MSESGDSEPIKDEPPNSSPLRETAPSAAGPLGKPPDRTTEAPELPPKPWKRRGATGSDHAAAEPRSRPALARNLTAPPAAPHSSAPAFGTVPPLVGFVVAATIVGAAGYLAGGFGPPLTQPAPGDIDAAPMKGAVHLKGNLDSVPPAAQTTVIAAAPAVARQTTDGVAAVTAAEEPGPAPSTASRAQMPTEDASGIATKMKLGADLVAAGDIATARMMFERAAEAGHAAGAFALAETYDPALLSKMHLRGGITPDPALARRWYERARDMGSAAASERIARLARP